MAEEGEEEEGMMEVEGDDGDVGVEDRTMRADSVPTGAEPVNKSPGRSGSCSGPTRAGIRGFGRCQVLPIQPVCPHCSSASTRVKLAPPDTETTSGLSLHIKTRCCSASAGRYK